MAETCSGSVRGGRAENQGRAPCLHHVPHNSTGKQDPNCRISALLCCLRQMVQLQAMMGFVSLNIRRVQSPRTLSLSSHSLKKSHLKVIQSCLCQGVLTSNQVPRKSSLASFLRKICFLHISYQDFKVVAESLSFHPWGIPSWRLHAGTWAATHLTQAGLCTWLPSLKVQTQGEGGRVTTTCVKVQDMRLEPSFSAWQTPTGDQEGARGTSTGKTSLRSAWDEPITHCSS